MTQTPSRVDARKQCQQPLQSLPGADVAAPAHQEKTPEKTADDAPAVLHVPVRMRGVYRYAPSLKGA